ncbi:MAG TPA: phospholipid carrier-dependent glycosyltransferase, partial [Chthoniobacterales bacterium]|nr:phospholipid carrier-dependent glycosyltransferase [Chthoniobacterales bacterium]
MGSWLVRQSRLAVGIGTVLVAFGFYSVGVPEKPPGFYIDESAIAYNAHCIAQSGKDEYGEPWPLYFRSFGEFKNPTFIYLLAAVFRLTGPNIFVARLLSASLGALAALLLGWLAFRMTRRIAPALLITASALLTPWLFEASRLVFEVAAYPLVCALFLFVLWRASNRERWHMGEVIALALGLALLTYTYSIGRLLGPLLALGLAFFITRRNLARVALTWLAFAITLIPLVLFARTHPDAVTGRFKSISSMRADAGAGENLGSVFAQFCRNLDPWRWLVTGEDNPRDHFFGTPALLLPTYLLAL